MTLDDVSEWADGDDLIDGLIEGLDQDDEDAMFAYTGDVLVREQSSGGYVVYKAQEVREG